MPTSIRDTAAASTIVAVAMLFAHDVRAQTPPKVVDAARLAPLLPPAWGSLQRGKVDFDNKPTITGGPHANAEAVYSEGSTAAFEAIMHISDGGEISANYYKMGANWLREDTRDETQHSLVLADGRRAQFTSMGKDIAQIETFVADRFVVRANCSHSSEAECKAALEKFDFRAIEKLKE